MESKVQQLLDRYNAGNARPDDLKEIENLLEAGEIALEHLHGFQQLEDRILKLEAPGPSPDLDDRFHQMVKQEKKAHKSFSWERFFSWPELGPRLALASVTLVLGLAVGYVLSSPAKKDEQIGKLGQEINALKELMMLSLLEKESATDRLKAVSLTQGMDQASKKVTEALIRTLNHDENVNVRLAALDALKIYTKDSGVRESLVRSIAQQESPLVQVALAELMAELQEKSAVKEFQNILKDGNTPPDIKEKISESMQII
jgi:hypothetical protein